MVIAIFILVFIWFVDKDDMSAQHRVKMKYCDIIQMKRIAPEAWSIPKFDVGYLVYQDDKTHKVYHVYAKYIWGYYQLMWYIRHNEKIDQRKQDMAKYTSFLESLNRDVEKFHKHFADDVHEITEELVQG